ncbi:FAD-binding protein [Ketobacter sp. MCCC 1A13808]|uniref:GMC family oxidoreductase n=1 Tax=Ketobacter sp. MCCC 1A13808 TaxID=2602738 RepID=UPI0012EC1A60|nr:GMC family oxidoreductase [Ketobacter sp. MCCC 1A13808]MVF12128.1 FAD-binding protein [Ketobacter sp. MCCC 1A13808]
MSNKTVVKGIPDLFRQGIESGWATHNGSSLTAALNLECDVLIIGSGAGGGTAAEILSQQGLKVILMEEGPLQTSNDFDMTEAKAYRNLYQEDVTRGTADGSLVILQGRAVGGSTTVNWTASFRTPDQTLDHWTNVHGLKGFTKEEMTPWYEKMEQRLNIHKWPMPPNANNNVIAKGCQQLGYDWQIIPRNVKGCWNLGYCGTGCPTNAKQSMLVTTIPTALDNGAELVYRARAETLIIENDAVQGAVGYGLKENGIDRTQPIRIQAKHTVMACGGINGPGLLLRSKAPDPHHRIGKRTFLHPVPSTLADFGTRIDGFYGAPQSVYSDHFLWTDGITGAAGFKMEVPPLQPSFVASIGVGHGKSHSDQMNRLPYLNMMIALIRDGFTEQSQGGTIFLRDDGLPGIDYPVNDYLREAVVRATKTMARVQFAAGAKAVRPIHTNGEFNTTLDKTLQHIDSLDLSINRMKLGSAHVMGGCAMGEDPRTSVVDSLGKFHHLHGLHIMDGSIFPTSIGANPQLSIYGMVARQATLLAQSMKA